MPADKALIPRASAIPRRRSFGYETQNKLCPEHQALILDFRR